MVVGQVIDFDEISRSEAQLCPRTSRTYNGIAIEGKAADIQRDAAQSLAALHLARSDSFDIVDNRMLTFPPLAGHLT